jgi:lantibiotic leader peptide-processing serine protease
MSRRLIFSLAAVLAVAACSEQESTAPNEAPVAAAVGSNAQSYVISYSAAEAGDLSQAITRAGGKVKKLSSRAGLATATAGNADFSEQLSKTRGVKRVVQDMVVQWVPQRQFGVAPDAGPSATPTGSTERWFPTMWNLKAVHAPEAWATGEQGRGARVAILDGGIWDQHVDIAPNLDSRRSASMVAGVPFNSDIGTLWHGTHVAGIVAAADNNDNLGTIGIAPKATIIGVKVLHNGSGSFGQIIDGIIYAADPINEGGAGANIINMSLGATFAENQNAGTQALIEMIGEATTYAWSRGVLVVVAAGNGDNQGHGIDFDNGNYIDIPAQSPHVLGVSALAPKGFAFGSTNYDLLASYSNFGSTIVDFSGPGGDTWLAQPNGNDALCTMAINPAPPLSPSNSVTLECYAYDAVVSSCRGTTTRNVCWVSGTSMAAPAVSAVAALIVGKYGSMAPDALADRLAASADDLGATGTDPIYGRGRVNALKAVTQ